MTANDVIEIAIAVVMHAGKVLIAQRPPGAALAGMWELPGGKVEQGETPAAAAKRECWEECQLLVEVGELYLTKRHDYAHGSLRLHFFAATPNEQSSQLPSRWIWVSPGDLDKYPFPPANAEILDILRAMPPND